MQNETVTLRAPVIVSYASGVLSFTDQDLDFTVDLEVDEESGESMLIASGRGINLAAPDAEDVVDVLRSAGMLDEGLSLAEVRQRQTLFQLNLLLDFVKEEIPYYQAEAYPSAPLSSLEEIATLPPLRKADLRARLFDLVPRQLDLAAGMASGDLSLGSTSGSTGERLQAVLGKEVGNNPALYDQLWFGPRGDRVTRSAVLTTPLCSPTVCHLGRASYEERITENGSVLVLNSSEDLFSVERPRIEQFAAELERFKADMLVFNPVYLHWFARRAREWGIALPPVKLLLSSYQYRSHLQTRGLRAHFPGAWLHDVYGCTEAQAMAGQECGNGRLHIRPEQCLLEVVKDGQPAAPGTIGAILMTTLASRTMPLIRYQIGDVGSVQNVPCDCLLDGCPSLTVHGRAKDMMWLAGQWITTRQFDDVIGEARDLDFYACRQLDDRTLRVEVVPALGQEGTFAKRELADKLSSRFSVAKVSVEVVHRLDPLPGSLKFGLTAGHRETPNHP